MNLKHCHGLSVAAFDSSCSPSKGMSALYIPKVSVVIISDVNVDETTTVYAATCNCNATQYRTPALGRDFESAVINQSSIQIKSVLWLVYQLEVDSIGFDFHLKSI